jgi:putative endonuclease
MSFLKAKAAHLRLGKRGENSVCEYVKSIGCEILSRNYHYGKDEIDIIALDGAEICFIEVKTRRFPLKTRPASGLREEQKKRIRRAALHYLAEIGNPSLPYRFDLSETVFSSFDIVELRYWRNFFGANKTQ